ncbi:phage tail assembly chaperone [Hoeflea sp.]|uniref:phage tail assembly chaperone n=1 Tax=Hoeflea sp. TaxID=1940281 RepID=UPI003BACDB84
MIRFGLGRLRLPPETFWALSLPELVALTGGGSNSGHATRSDLQQLMARFPDRSGPAAQDSAPGEEGQSHRASDATRAHPRPRSTGND